MNAALLIREARLRAGLNQAELAAHLGREAGQVARWERGDVEPSFASLQEILRACGYQLATKLERFEPVDDAVRAEIAKASPAERVDSMMVRRADNVRYNGGF